MASMGGARHVWYLSEAQLLEAMKMSWLSQPPAILLFATTKSSIAILTLRLIGKTTFWRKIILCVVIAVVSVSNVLGIVFTFAQCTPARALWTPGLPASCWDPTVQEHFNYFLGGTSLVLKSWTYSRSTFLTDSLITWAFSCQHLDRCTAGAAPDHLHS